MRCRSSMISSRAGSPIFCGGTGLYLDAVLNGGSYTDESAADTKPDETLRASLLADAERYGAEDLWRRLMEVDPESASAIHPNQHKRGRARPRDLPLDRQNENRE
ncbi:MAG: tRNA dimethylallyltransferase [Eubacteriales bacterium]